MCMVTLSVPNDTGVSVFFALCHDTVSKTKILSHAVE